MINKSSNESTLEKIYNMESEMTNNKSIKQCLQENNTIFCR